MNQFIEKLNANQSRLFCVKKSCVKGYDLCHLLILQKFFYITATRFVSSSRFSTAAAYKSRHCRHLNIFIPEMCRAIERIFSRGLQRLGLILVFMNCSGYEVRWYVTYKRFLQLTHIEGCIDCIPRIHFEHFFACSLAFSLPFSIKLLL